MSSSEDPPVPKKTRVRAYKPKVKTGCETCKKRRIKCDEGRPSCHQCVKTGRICNGYKEKSKWSNFTHSKDGTITILSRPLSSSFFGSEDEVLCFGAFQSHTVPQLQSFYASEFWNRTILLTCYHSPAIRHAAIALGALHMELQSGGLKECPHGSEFAIRHYVKAISYLKQPDSSQTVDIALMTCLLFICFDSVRGHMGSAMSHVESGVNIVSEIHADNGPKSKKSAAKYDSMFAPLSPITVIFMRLDSQITQIQHKRGRKLISPALDHIDIGYQPEIPPLFTTFEEARNSLDYIWAACMRAVQDYPRQQMDLALAGPRIGVQFALDLIRDFSKSRLKQWNTAFEGLLRQRNNIFTKHEQRAIHLLNITCIVTTMVLTIDTLRAHFDETVWDAHIKEFETIIKHSKGIIATLGNDEAPEASFCLDSGFMLALHFVGAKCRDGKIRRDAIAVLRSRFWQEGLVSSALTARVAERILEIEEDGLNSEGTCDTIPNSSRIGAIDMKYDPNERRAVIDYLKCAKAMWLPKEAVKEHLEW